MAVDKSVVEEQIKALGKIDTFGTKKEIAYLPEILTPDEVILGLCSGFVDGNTWLCTITNQRIILLDKGLIYGLKQLELPIAQIKSVSHKIGMLMGELCIDTGGEIKKIGNILKADTPKIASIISDLLHKRESAQANRNTQTTSTDDDMITKLERIAALKEKGILTEEEFIQQKEKILHS